MKTVSRLAALACLSGLLVVSTPAHAVAIQTVTGPHSGVTAWLVEDHHLPIVTLHFAFRGGSEQDPADRQGLATLTTALLTEGAGDQDAEAFHQAMADGSITLSVAAGRDTIDGAMKCLRDDCGTGFDLLHRALTKPRFDDDAVERERAQQFSEIRQQFGNPNWQARYALLTHLYPGHPYSERHLGTLETLPAITRDDIRTFAAHHLARSNAIVAVAGDITPAQLATALDAVFGDLPATADLAPIPDAADAATGTTIRVNRAGTQTELLFAMPGPKRDTADWYATDIANYILGGGGFSSRLMHEVRDKAGLTYGIDTSLSPSEHAALIEGQAAIDNGNVGEAMATIRTTLANFRAHGVTTDEIDAAKDYLTGAEPLTLASLDKIAARMVTIQREHLGRDYLDRYAAIIRGVTPDQVAAAIVRWFDPAKITWVMVGQPDHVTADVTQDTVRQ